MYDTKYECRYQKDDIFLESDDITDNEKDFIRNILYQEDLLSILNMNENDNFDDVMCELYGKLKSCDALTKCMKETAAKLISEDEILGLCILYSYDYMHITHRCVCFYLETGNIPDKELTILEGII